MVIREGKFCVDICACIMFYSGIAINISCFKENRLKSEHVRTFQKRVLIIDSVLFIVWSVSSTEGSNIVELVRTYSVSTQHGAYHMFIFVILGTYVKLKPLLWHMGGEYRPIACPNYPLDGIKDLRLLTTTQAVIHLLVRAL